MFCQKCGSQLNDDAAFCPKCGSQIGVVSGVQAHGTYANGVSRIKPKKWIPKLLIGIGAFLHFLGFAFLTYAFFSALDSLSYDIVRASILDVNNFLVAYILEVIYFLVVLGEFICVIANKKVVFVLSIIQAIFFVIVFNFFMFVMTSSFNANIHMDTLWIFGIFLFELPFVPCIMLLVGGSMFRTANVINELSGAAR